MRVLFLALYPDTAASPRYRVTQFLPYLREQGIECTVASAVSDGIYEHRGRRPASLYHLHETRRRIRQILSARRFDLVFLQKALMSGYVRGLDSLFFAVAPNFVYDIDDAVHLNPPHLLPRPWRFLQDKRQIDGIVRRARTVLAGNAWLAEETRRLGGNPELFPTVVDTERFIPGHIAPNTYRIGWIGSPSTASNLDVAKPALLHVKNLEVVLVGAPDSCGIPNATVPPWSFDHEVELVQRCAVGIMPLAKHEWNRGKCALKALQYMACGIPCVATPFGAITDIIRQDENGLFADTPDTWIEALDRLRDPALRRRLGDAGRATVEERYSLRNAPPRLAQILRDAAGGRP